MALLIGFEAGTLRRFTLRRRGYRNIGIVVGDDLELAERRFFDAWVRQDATAAPAPGGAPALAASLRMSQPGFRRARPVSGARSRPVSVAIVDYGSGNLHSAAKAFERAARECGYGEPIVVTSDPDVVARAERVVLPGRRRLCGLPPRARCGRRHGGGARRPGCAARAGRSSAFASACS